MIAESERNAPGDLRTGAWTLYTYLCVSADEARDDGVFLIAHARHKYFDVCSSGIGTGGQSLLWSAG